MYAHNKLSFIPSLQFTAVTSATKKKNIIIHSVHADALASVIAR